MSGWTINYLTTLWPCSLTAHFLGCWEHPSSSICVYLCKFSKSRIAESKGILINIAKSSKVKHLLKCLFAILVETACSLCPFFGQPEMREAQRGQGRTSQHSARPEILSPPSQCCCSDLWEGASPRNVWPVADPVRPGPDGPMPRDHLGL